MKSADPGVSRREFAKKAATAAAVALVGSESLAYAHQQKPQAPPDIAPKKPSSLPAPSQGEVDTKLKNVVRRYGDRLTPAQVEKVRKTLSYHQKMLDTVRAYPLENWDGPASVLRVDPDPGTRNAILAELNTRERKR